MLGTAATRILSLTAVIGMLLAALVAMPAQAAVTTDQVRNVESSTSSRPITGKADQRARAVADDTGGAAVAMVIPDAYRVCGSNKCVWVESTNYCAPGAYCGQKVIISGWAAAGGGYCSASVGCATINGRNYKVWATSTYYPNDQSKVMQCAASVGLTAADVWTRGFSKLALAGVGLTAWGCAGIN